MAKGLTNISPVKIYRWQIDILKHSYKFKARVKRILKQQDGIAYLSGWLKYLTLAAVSADKHVIPQDL